MYLNKVQIIGNITKDIELKMLPNGTAVTSFSIATNRTIKDASGAKKDIAEFHNIVVFGKTAELIHQYMKKGHQIYVEGRLQTRSWDGQDGKKLYRTEIVCENMQFGNNKKEGSGTTYEAGDYPEAQNHDAQPDAPADQDVADVANDMQTGAATAAPAKPRKEVSEVQYPDNDINPEDIPF